MQYSRATFDEQANSYDQRVGLPEPDCQQIVQAILALTEAQLGDLVVEVGAGTGQIGQWFAPSPVQYLGFDLSQNMLNVFRQRLNSKGKTMTLVRADGNQRWPVASATAGVIFSSRAIHLLNLEHVVEELFRVAQPARAALIIGRIQRQRESVKARMQQEMQRLLRQRGFQGRQGEQNQRQLLELCCQRGAKLIAPVVVARWTVVSTPELSIKSWEQTQGLGGTSMPLGIKQEILEELRIWGKGTFGGLEQQVESEEAYVLQGAYLTGVALSREDRVSRKGRAKIF
ncbi:MAG: class I SAM-dependent methyltransferase [Prochloron sp. SP5CPC1]|nr:class I SAM-dependent methyltransferase [Candidatus Paraprochloron terpiosi SP5CPC1]